MERRLKRECEIVAEEIDELPRGDDPVSKRRTIRSHYRDIENRINEGKDDLANGHSAKFMAIMNEVENVHQHVNKPREQVADAETLFGLTRTLAASVKALTNGGITPAEFVSCLIREFGKQESMKQCLEDSRCVSWQNIGHFVSPIFMNGPGFMTMIGPLKNTLKQRKLVTRVKRSRSMSKARPEELGKAAKVLTDTYKNLRVMFEILKKEKRVTVEILILNRNSFAQTVENMFALSFLVKDGRVRIDVDESGSQVVVPCNGPSAEEIKSGAVKNHEFVFRFDFNDWKLLKDMVPEGDELMPPRDVFANADAKAKREPCDQEFSPADTSCLVQKFSRNRTVGVSCGILA